MNLSAHNGIYYKILLILSFIALTILSIFYLDSYAMELASKIRSSFHLTSQSKYNKHWFAMATYVCYIVVLLSYLFFAVYHVPLKYRKLIRCFFMTVILISLGFFCKEILKDFFGRTGLAHADIFNFHLLAIKSGRLFPSGHMTILTAVAVNISYFYPKSTLFVYFLNLLFLLTMVLLKFHFLSDCLAGISLGLIIAYCTLSYKNYLFSAKKY